MVASVMDALNEALESNGTSADGGAGEPIETEEGVGNTTLEEGEEGESTEGTEGEEGGEEAEGTEGEEGGEEAPSGEEPTREELAEEAAKLGIDVRDGGKFKSKEQLTKEILAAQEAAEKTAKPKQKVDADGKPVVEKPKKEADPLNDPIDKSLNVKTQERIRTLIDRTKAAEESSVQAQGNFDTFIKGIQATNTSPEQYGETLSFLKLYNSGDPAQQKSALDLIENLADQLSTMLGVERKVSDPLAMHPDLLQAVKEGKVTRQLATENARFRNGTQMRTTMQTQQQQNEEFQRNIESEKTQGKADLDTLEQTLRASDPQYDAKLAVILPAVQVALRSVRPSEWKAAFTKIYREARTGVPARKVILSKNQPNRANKGGSTSGGGSVTPKGGTGPVGPKDAMEALNAALSKGR